MDNLERRYTCKEYREEMTLLTLRRRLYRGGLSENEQARIKEAIEQLKKEMDME